VAPEGVSTLSSKSTTKSTQDAMTGSTLETSKEPLFERIYKIARALRPLPTQ